MVQLQILISVYKCSMGRFASVYKCVDEVTRFYQRIRCYFREGGETGISKKQVRRGRGEKNRKKKRGECFFKLIELKKKVETSVELFAHLFSEKMYFVLLCSSMENAKLQKFHVWKNSFFFKE